MRAVACFVVVVASVMGWGPAGAERLSDPGELVPNFNPETLMSVMREFGGETELLEIGNRPTVGVKLDSGAKFLMTPTACALDTGDCRGVSIRALFTGANATTASVNRFNQLGTIPKTVLEGDRVVIYHYLIADYGIPRGNLDSHIGVLEFTISQYKRFGGSAAPRQSVSLSEETHHVGTLPMVEPQHPSGFVSLPDAPDAYFND